jgi:hypothetical protein
MPGAFLAGCLLLAGITLLATAFVMQTILLEMVVWTVLLAGTGALLLAWGAWALRARSRRRCPPWV